jgi:drug/metabolite transporter (DMT)-like permease
MRDQVPAGALSVGLVWAVLSTLGWSLFDLTRKSISMRVPIVAASVVLVLLQIPMYAAWSLVADGGLSLNLTQDQMAAYLIPFLASAILNAVAVALFLVAVSWAPLSLAVPMLSLTPAVAAFGAGPLLGERLSVGQWTGLGMIISAALAMGLWAAPRNPDSSGVEPDRVRWGLGLMSIVALCFALIPVLDKQCLNLGVPAPAHAFYQTAVVTALLALGFARPSGRSGLAKVSRAPIGLWLGAAVFSSLAFASQLRAVEIMPVGLFEAVKRGLGLLLALGFGVWFFGEKITRRQMVCALGLLVGLFVLLTRMG